MRHKKKKLVVPTSFTSDEEEIPLKVIKQEKEEIAEDPHSYHALCVPRREPCEFCDRISVNRYDSILHNVKHIIIPLLNQTVHQCDICLHHFTSIKELSSHKKKKHTLSELVATKNLVNFNNPKDGTYVSDLISIVKTENSVVNSSIVGNSMVTRDVPVVVKVEKESDMIVTNSDATLTHSDAQSESNDGYSIKNRLLFEEDIISLDNRVLTDLTTECQVQMEMFPSWDNPSVHYDDLVKPGVFRCKKCGKRFPRRYEAIIHEAKHLVIKNSQVMKCNMCKTYILGDLVKLNHHKLTKHREKYSQEFSNELRKVGGKIEENGADEPYVRRTTTLKYCELCFSFCKNKTLKQNYECIGVLNKLGKRYKCQKCGNKFFEIKLIRRETTFKHSNVSKKRVRRKEKVLSNAAKLKIISQRFKKMKN
ncbi:uncharacterized protein LOC142985095 [Anticarsia gemmatalis]|uniref:uncharacterized protein LOC142985095 n=1 Tax=Anticarsia gemmatalis TaxID=129554 RepID=UPI003F758EC5